MAQDLRAVVGAIRMAGDLERIGDLAKNIAKRVSAVGAERDAARPVALASRRWRELVLEQVQGRDRGLCRRATPQA